MTKVTRLLLSLVYIVVLLTICYNLPFSALFRRFHSYDELFRLVERSNQLRTKRGKEHFTLLDSKSSTRFYQQQRKHGDLVLAVGIITIQRTFETKNHESFGYLYQSSSSVDNLMKKERIFMNNSFAFICNVDLYPKRHKDAQHLSQYMPYVERYGNNTIGLRHDLMLPNSKQSFKSVDQHETLYEKETYDYVFCMQVAATLKPKYILLIEEDAVPNKDFSRVLHHLFDFHLKENSNHPQPLFIKFYYPSKWQGFALRFTEVFDLISFSILGTTIYLLIYYLYCYWSHQRLSENVKKIVFIAFIVSLVSCCIIGRQNLIELRRLLPQFYRIQSSEACCTQAMLYPLDVVDSLSQFMIARALAAHTDLLIWDFAEIKKMPSYQIEPNLFHHTGLHSALPLKQKHPEEFIFSD